MKRLHVERAIALLVAIPLWVVILLVTQVGKSHAQTGGFIWSERGSSQPHGEYVYMWNATGTQINAGTVVMSDSTSSTVSPQVPLGKGFRTWNHTPSEVRRLIGVLVNDVPGYMPGKVLVYGWTNYVLTDLTAMTGGTYLRASFTTDGALTAYVNADSANSWKPVVGQFARYASGTTLYGYAKIDFRAVSAGGQLSP